MSRALYVIRSTIDPADYWSNEFGWTDNDSRDVFGDYDRQTLRLPLDGEWVRLSADYGVDES